MSLQLSAPTAYSIHISWSPPLINETNGIVEYYVVNMTASETAAEYQFKASSTNITVNDLHPYYTYHIIVSAFTVSLGPFSASESVTTLQDGRHKWAFSNYNP